MRERLIAFIPAFNEASTLGAVITQTRPHVAEVVVINDGSSDDTEVVARRNGAVVLSHERNRGKGAAIATALDYFARSDAPWAVFLDADGQHAPDEIPRLLAAARESGASVVVGNRMADTGGMPLLRRITNRFMSWLVSRLSRQRIWDSQCGFRLLHRDALAAIRLSSEHFEAETEMLIQAGRAGYKIASAPIKTLYDPSRRSRIRPVRDTVRFLMLLWRLALENRPSEKKR